jgi:hypothetical protein
MGCQPVAPKTVHVLYDFTDGVEGWTSDVSDYSNGNLDTLEFESGLRNLPEELGTGTGYYLKTMNRSDDAFMFLKRKLTAADGVAPGQRYRISYTIHLGSNLSSGCAGIGGAPESSYFKAGGATAEPAPQLDDAAQFVGLTVDKGQQSTGGPAASLVGDNGNITNRNDACADGEPYLPLERTHTHPTPVAADSAGNIWLLLGTDSGYEGLTALYFQSIEITLTPAVDP